MQKYRPKIICVEYDNTFPVCIDFVPRQARHGLQCSSRAMFRLMCEKGYAYLNSFFGDHVFIANELIPRIVTPLPSMNVMGSHAFNIIAPRNLYSYRSVLCNQESHQGGQGIIFYQTRIQILLDNGYLMEAAFFYTILSQIFHDYKPFILDSRGDKYAEKYHQALFAFDMLYSELSFLHCRVGGCFR